MTDKTPLVKTGTGTTAVPLSQVPPQATMAFQLPTFNYGNPDKVDIMAARNRYAGYASAEEPPSYNTEARHETREAARGRSGRERDMRGSQQRFRRVGQRGQDRDRQGGGLRDGEESADGKVYDH
jgi:hypothetical protein